MREYRIAKGWMIFLYIGHSVLLAVGIFCLMIPFNESSVLLGFIVIPISLAVIVLSIYVLFETYGWTLLIFEDKIVVKSFFFGTRSLTLSEVKGYRMGKNYISIYPLNPEYKKVHISYLIRNRDEVNQWLEKLFPDLDVSEGDEEENLVIKNLAFGLTEEVRKERLGEAKSASRIMNIGGWLILIWLIIYPDPYQVAIGIASLFPLMIMAMGYRYSGIMKVDEETHSNMPSMASGLAVSVMALVWRAFKDFTVLYDQRFWIIVSIMGLVLLIFYLLPLQPFRTVSHYVSAVAFFLVTFSYSFAMFVLTNCLLDRSKPEIFKTTVIEKQVTGENDQTHKFKLKPWGAIQEPKEVEVSSGEYESVTLGDSVSVVQHQGYLKSVWIEIVIE